MKQINISFFLILIFFYSCNNSESFSESDINDELNSKGEFIDDRTYRVFPGISDNYDIAEFRIWIPENHDNLRAILILADSHNSNGLGMVLNNHWQEYAREENLALLSLHFKSTGVGSFYGDASRGSGRALIHALDTLAYSHNLNKLKTIPLLARGYSAGGVFGFYLSEFIPDRMVAFANIRGGGVSKRSSLNNSIPGIMIIGENDFDARIQNIKNVIISNRIEGGNWAYAIEPHADHFGNLDASDELIKEFFSTSLAKRLSDDSPDQLQTILESSGWLGNHATKEYSSFENYSDLKSEASWLIDENFADLWKDFQLKLSE